MISFKNVSCTFEDGAGIENVTFNIESGEFVCIIGPTGAGKTTFLKLIYMDIFPEEGTVGVDKYRSDKIKKRSIPMLRRRVGMVFQDFELLRDRSVFDNIAIPLHVQGVGMKMVKEEVENVLDRLGISDRRDHLPSQLSGGEQQIVSLARALVKDPLIILADEPTGNLDPAASLKVVELLEEINRDGTAVLMATHNFSLVKDRGYRFMQIVDGEVQT
ncbi:MAG TPA: ATP-binding cassette domain-containing protein [Candidatus Marinimicrobia bacterium]|jgi:cell division transport system ATP-binding protein|nr:ATP-binding cassette domain-containing protein [Candidatus Neomarinimicrobiota bacterium]MDP7121299.1 ATP-binding cassette domain-containing protein [Candidatus Neomarinimicrobiota bacterium]MDP7483974.1 ATP-binding cassette domain-containing protein [Candidatus Neomarinimicrobiota bacterium]MDP7527825.1 ATP-binding cassette domain-containing protein [Candidatus Neomarinimicrobiota bacterium]MDP7715541.1 ATP-binding cassette domain-containing protein [Candidatus Neomarinimicrobiota bacterium|tara:strand:+ start:4180 stop:4830 length:651 start_codon:yes stop_codon:yes gene_type:complete